MSESAHPEFWNTRYESSQTPWDFGGVPADAAAFMKRKRKGGKRLLIPGCGTGHEVKAFAAAGFDVVAIDFSLAAVAQARALAGPDLAARVLHGDFFAHDFALGSFDFVYERTFICSFHPDRRPAYRDRVATLLRHGGDLVGYFYYQTPDLLAGPPYGFAWGTSDELFGRHFLLVKDDPVADSLPLFQGRERWQEQRRTAHPV